MGVDSGTRCYRDQVGGLPVDGKIARTPPDCSGGHDWAPGCRRIRRPFAGGRSPPSPPGSGMIAMLREPTSEAVCVPALRSAGGSAGGEAECSGGASSAKFAAEGSGEGVLAHPAGSPWRISIPAPRTGRRSRALSASDVVVTPGRGIEKRLFGAALLYFPGTDTVRVVKPRESALR